MFQMIIYLIFPLCVIVKSLELETESCGNKICVHKCCPLGKSIVTTRLGKKCVPFTRADMFTKDVLVYDSEKIELTNKTFDDKFQVSPNRFNKSKDFQKTVVFVGLLDFIPRLTETGVLQLEFPNAYERWTPVKPGNFCIDYGLTKNRTKANLRFYAIIPSNNHDEPSIILTAGIFISCFFLLLVFFVYLLLPELRNLCGMILMAYVGCLFMAFLLLAIVQISFHPVPVCIRLTLSIYFFFLATFCWMNVMSYDIWWTFRGYAKARPIHRRGERFKFLMYSLYAFGVPALMTIALGVLNSVDLSHIPWFIQPKIIDMGCFIEGGQKMVYLYMPMLILILSNWMFYMMTAFNIWRLSRGTAVLDTAAAGNPQAHRSNRHRFMVYLKLSVIMGLNWLLEIVSFFFPGFKMWYISDIYNVLIGLAIFLIFVFKKKTYTNLKRRYSSGKVLWYPSTKSNSTSASDSNQETSTLQVCSNPVGNGYSINSNSKTEQRNGIIGNANADGYKLISLNTPGFNNEKEV